MSYRRLTIRYGLLPEPESFSLPWNAHVPVPLVRPHWRPPVDFFGTAAELQVRVEVAGMVEGDFAVRLQGESLVIEGERRWEGEPGGDLCFHAAEIRYGPFRLELPVGPGYDARGLEVAYERGLLRVRLARQPKEDA